MSCRRKYFCRCFARIQACGGAGTADITATVILPLRAIVLASADRHAREKAAPLGERPFAIN